MGQVRSFHTVIEDDNGHFLIRYVEPPNWEVRQSRFAYRDPGEANREFKKFERFQRSELLRKDAFDRRILRHKQDADKWKAWSRR